MKTAAKVKTNPARSFEEQYRSALREYVLHGGEAALSRGYELGRRALGDGKNLIDIFSLHQHDLMALLTRVDGEKERARMLKAAVHFLAECLSPYEMAHRGFQDAVRSLRRFNETLEDEIRRVAHAVHDDAGQLLVAVHLALADLGRGLDPPQREQVAAIAELLTQAESQLRHYSHELRPTILDDLGWIPAVRSLAGAVAKRVNLPIEVVTDVTGRLAKPAETALYRIVQEALTNIAKHAKASRVRIRVFSVDHALCCSVEDDGIGFDPRAVRTDRTQGRLGLLGIQERTDSIGATLSVDSSPGRGTTILIRVPME